MADVQGEKALSGDSFSLTVTSMRRRNMAAPTQQRWWQTAQRVDDGRLSTVSCRVALRCDVCFHEPATSTRERGGAKAGGSGDCTQLRQAELRRWAEEDSSALLPECCVGHVVVTHPSKPPPPQPSPTTRQLLSSTHRRPKATPWLLVGSQTPNTRAVTPAP